VERGTESPAGTERLMEEVVERTLGLPRLAAGS